MVVTAQEISYTGSPLCVLPLDTAWSKLLWDYYTAAINLVEG